MLVRHAGTYPRIHTASHPEDRYQQQVTQVELAAFPLNHCGNMEHILVSFSPKSSLLVYRRIHSELPLSVSSRMYY